MKIPGIAQAKIYNKDISAIEDNHMSHIVNGDFVATVLPVRVTFGDEVGRRREARVNNHYVGEVWRHTWSDGTTWYEFTPMVGGVTIPSDALTGLTEIIGDTYR